MPRVIHADLLAAQLAICAGTATGTLGDPYIEAVFTSRDGLTTHDYTFNPTLGTNRIVGIDVVEEPYGRGGTTSQAGNTATATIILDNSDLAVPKISPTSKGLVGYWVDLYWGRNTASGLKVANTPMQRLWVVSQDSISAPNEKYVILELWDVWQLMRNEPINLGTSPQWQADNDNIAKPGSLFTGMTIYEILGYAISNFGSVFTGYTWTLDALGTQDDGIISALVPVTPDTLDSILYPNRNNSSGQSFASFICDIMAATHCYLRARDGLAFKVVYPQESDAPDETYYALSSDGGHVFYEAHDKYTVLIPNMVQVYGDPQEDDYSWDAVGNAYDPTAGEWTGSNYTGIFGRMPRYYADPRVATNTDADNLSATLLAHAISQTQSGRLTIPHDARVEMYDFVTAFDTRGS